MKIFIYTDSETDISHEGIFLSMPYKDLKRFRKENPDLKPLRSYNVNDVVGVDVDELKKEVKKLQKENNELKKQLTIKHEDSSQLIDNKEALEAWDLMMKHDEIRTNLETPMRIIKKALSGEGR